MRFKRQQAYAVLALTISLLLVGARLFMFSAHADKLPDRLIQLASSDAGVTTTYKFAWQFPASSSIGSIRIQFCSDTPLLDYPCTPPAGLDVSGAVLQSQTGETGFNVDPATDANDIYLTRPASLTIPGSASYEFTNIVNPTSEGTYYARVQTYSSTDATGAYTDGGGLAFAINAGVSIQTYVPPFLLLCGGISINDFDCSSASGDYLNFGELSSATTKSGMSQLVLATNAASGYYLYASGTTMTAGNSVIPPLSSGDVSRPGASQFGLNLVSNTTPSVGNDVQGPGSALPTANYSIPDRYRFVPGEQIANSVGPSDFRKFTISYIVNIGTNQAAGIYVTTISYVAVASF